MLRIEVVGPRTYRPWVTALLAFFNSAAQLGSILALWIASCPCISTTTPTPPLSILHPTFQPRGHHYHTTPSKWGWVYHTATSGTSVSTPSEGRFITPAMPFLAPSIPFHSISIPSPSPAEIVWKVMDPTSISPHNPQQFHGWMAGGDGKFGVIRARSVLCLWSLPFLSSIAVHERGLNRN